MVTMVDHTRERPAARRAAAAVLLLAVVAAAGLRAALRPAPAHEGLSFSSAVFDKKGRLVSLSRTPDDKLRLWTPLREVSPLMARATELQEQSSPRALGASPLATSVAALRFGGGRLRLAWNAWRLQLSCTR